MSMLRRIKNSMLESHNPIIRGIGTTVYRMVCPILNGRVCAFFRYRPFMDDRKYIEWKYKRRLGVKPNLDAPKNFNEKNNWRKLYDRRERYTAMVDKCKLKTVVAETCGEDYVFPMLGVWNDARHIDFSALPDQFVLKANHAGGVIVCRDKASFDTRKAIKELSKLQKVNYFHLSREWPYKNVERRILCEQYMGENLTDYKNYCFNGKLLYTFVWKNESRADGRKPKAYFCGAYDRNWGRTEIEIDYPSMEEIVERPACYDEMVMVAEKLSEDIPFVRVDCYEVDRHVYVGEMTFFPWGGFQKFKDEYWNDYLGQLEKLPCDTE